MIPPGAIHRWRARKADSPPPALLLAAAGGVLVIGVLHHLVAPVGIAIAGGLITVACTGGDRFLRRTALLAFGVRVAATLGFHWLSVLDVPALDSLRTTPAGGYRFWILALDAPFNHQSALRGVLAWRDGTEFPTGTGPEYFVLIALVYLAFGPNPLNATLWNALFGALAVVAGHRIATRLAGASAARPGALLIALWPSGVLWSTQLLKDTICLALGLALPYLIMRLVEPPAESSTAGRARWAGLLLGLFVATLLLHQFRHFIVQILLPAPLVFVVHALVRRTAQSPWRIVAAGSVIVVMVLAASASRRIDVDRVFAPRDPHIGHTTLGVAAQSHGDLDAARRHYERALALVADHPPALKGLGTIAQARGTVPEAIAYYERYLARQPGDADVRRALDTLRATAAAAALSPVVPVPVPPVAHHIPQRRSWQYQNVVAALGQMRGAFIESGGHSQMDVDVKFRDAGELLRFVPRALAHVLLAPYPWQWFTLGGSTGAFRALSALESLLLYMFVVPQIVGLGLGVRRRSPDALFLMVFVVAQMALLGLVVSNLGTLFRLRLQSLFLLFTTAGLGLAWLRRRPTWSP